MVIEARRRPTRPPTTPSSTSSTSKPPTRRCSPKPRSRRSSPGSPTCGPNRKPPIETADLIDTFGIHREGDSPVPAVDPQDRRRPPRSRRRRQPGSHANTTQNRFDAAARREEARARTCDSARSKTAQRDAGGSHPQTPRRRHHPSRPRTRHRRTRPRRSSTSTPPSSTCTSTPADDFSCRPTPLPSEFLDRLRRRPRRRSPMSRPDCGESSGPLADEKRRTAQRSRIARGPCRTGPARTCTTPDSLIAQAAGLDPAELPFVAELIDVHPDARTAGAKPAEVSPPRARTCPRSSTTTTSTTSVARIDPLRLPARINFQGVALRRLRSRRVRPRTASPGNWPSRTPRSRTGSKTASAPAASTPSVSKTPDDLGGRRPPRHRQRPNPARQAAAHTASSAPPTSSASPTKTASPRSQNASTTSRPHSTHSTDARSPSPSQINNLHATKGAHEHVPRTEWVQHRLRRHRPPLSPTSPSQHSADPRLQRPPPRPPSRRGGRSRPSVKEATGTQACRRSSASRTSTQTVERSSTRKDAASRAIDRIDDRPDRHPHRRPDRPPERPSSPRSPTPTTSPGSTKASTASSAHLANRLEDRRDEKSKRATDALTDDLRDLPDPVARPQPRRPTSTSYDALPRHPRPHRRHRPARAPRGMVAQAHRLVRRRPRPPRRSVRRPPSATSKTDSNPSTTSSPDCPSVTAANGPPPNRPAPHPPRRHRQVPRRTLASSSRAATADFDDDQIETWFKRLQRFMNLIRRPDEATAARANNRDRDYFLDVRKHIVITAVALDANGVERSTYAALGGKSGGETQELIAFIVGAALRFQLGDEANSPPPVRPVFLDEGFVKSDSEFAGRAVSAWKGLGFQLIIGAPLDKVTALEPHVDKVLAMSKNAKGYSYLTELTPKPPPNPPDRRPQPAALTRRSRDHEDPRRHHRRHPTATRHAHGTPTSPATPTSWPHDVPPRHPHQGRPRNRLRHRPAATSANGATGHAPTTSTSPSHTADASTAPPKTIPTHVTVPDLDTAAAIAGRDWARPPHPQRRNRLAHPPPTGSRTSPDHARLLRATDNYTDTDFDTPLTVADWFSHHDATGLHPTPSPHPRRPRQVAQHPPATHPRPHRHATTSASSHATQPASTSPTSTPTTAPPEARCHDSATVGDPFTPAYQPTRRPHLREQGHRHPLPAHPRRHRRRRSRIRRQHRSRVPMAHRRPPPLLLGRHRRPRLRNPQRLPRRRRHPSPASSWTPPPTTPTSATAPTPTTNGNPSRPAPRKPLPHLTDAERAVYDRLTDPDWTGHRRIEQERIPLTLALAELERHP